ncbi:hypothetical protein BKG95_08735 [Rodentibacter pneumotropicus]|uniref:DUF924 domain-containing protein n=1 Tax=Rodentibacter pneumotropicus TaxID=758 RepID=A0AAW5L8X7_9PAST|nr:DUF924 family protein [Rodentibacter pneumotropicus]MCQ9120299.1 DUF924 domain-containing protein [Rodentibacter pneumotropicus]OOF67126.1 hypothetical protein BKG95_08735 [Rodentibacter pneumotropicus]
MSYQRVLDFWFSEETKPFWFAKSEEFDHKIRDQFYDLWLQAAQSELSHWRETVHGRLAEIIVLDQFSRNLHRDSPLAFAQDNMAIALAQEAIKQPEFKNMTVRERHFMLMPLMHSESKVIHEQAVPLFEQFGPEESVDFELKHKVIIESFGRYPHRNAVLGRESSSEEIEFLTQPGSSF